MSSIASTSESSSGVTAATPGIVDQHRDAGVGAQQCFDALEIGLVVEIGCDDLDGSAGLVGETLCQIVEALAIARHQDQIVAAPGEAVGIDSADA